LKLVRRVKYILTLRVVPIGTCGTSLSDYIAEVERVIASMNLRHELTASATIIELEDFTIIPSLLNMVIDRLRRKGVNRVLIDISIDYRLDKELSIEGKVESVKRRL